MPVKKFADQAGRLGSSMATLKRARRVELGAESRGALDQARDAAVDPVERGCEDDRGEREFELALDRHPDAGEAGA